MEDLFAETFKEQMKYLRPLQIPGLNPVHFWCLTTETRLSGNLVKAESNLPGATLVSTKMT